MTWAVVLLLSAVALFSLEALVPSFGLLSLLAAACYAFSISLAFDEGINVGWSFVVLGVILAPLAFLFGMKMLPKTPFGRLLIPGPPPGSHKGGAPLTEGRTTFLGLRGTTATDLRPAGTVLFDGQPLDVVSGGEFIPKGTPVEVIAIQGIRSVVRATTETPPEDTP